MTVIALVDDDAAHRTAVRMVLEAHGIKATWCEGETLHEARALAASVDLLVMDGLLPDGHGRDAAGLGCPVLFVSGLGEIAGAPCIPKPINAAALVAQVRALLAGHADGQAPDQARSKSSRSSIATGRASVRMAQRLSAVTSGSVHRTEQRPSTTT